MDSLPSLQSLHQSLTCEDAAEAEEELLSVISHLLVCAIEDPGIPNPVRHTTLLGQSLRTADITNSNISEILRIYLYAVATGEVRTMTGATLDREREKRIADHHQVDSEHVINSSTGKNHVYYEHLHENMTWKLSECLKDKPFVALNPTVKAQILAHLCNDLLLNKAVVKQIEGSLDSMAQHKREKFLIENRIRKYKHLHTRKVRMEQFERQQLLAKQHQEAALKEGFAEPKQQLPQPQPPLNQTTENADNNNETLEKVDSSQSLVKNPSNLTNASSLDNLTDVSEVNNHKEDVAATNDLVVNNKSSEETDSQATKTTTTEETKSNKTDEFALNDSSRNLNNGANTPDINSLLNKKIINRELAGDVSTTDGIMDDDLSDLESEGTTLEEDEDNRMTSDEVQKKLEKILKSSYQNKMLLEQSCNQLRATCYGQDRYWRRYWHLPKAGGIFVEGLESAQNEILKYHAVLEEMYEKDMALTNENGEEPTDIDVKRRSRKRKLTDADDDMDGAKEDEPNDGEQVDSDDDDEEENIPEAHANYIADANAGAGADADADADVDADADAPQSDSGEPASRSSTPLIDEGKHENDTENGPEKPDEKKNSVSNEDDGMMDIEDSIPTAILVQKANKNDETVVEVNSQIGGVNVNPAHVVPHGNAAIDQSTAVAKQESEQNCDNKPKLENGNIGTAGENQGINTERNHSETETDGDHNDVANNIKLEQADGIEMDNKKEIKEELIADVEIKTEVEQSMEKWFSIANREIQLSSMETSIPYTSQATYSNLTCDLILQCQGNRWDIGNNAHHFHVPVEPTPANLTFSRDSVLSLSGLDEDMMARVVKGESKETADGEETDETETKPSTENVNDTLKIEETLQFQLPTYMTNSLGNISTFIQCDNPPPLQMTPDEQQMLEEVKINGLPKRKEKNFVQRELRHGWWKINEVECLNEVVQCLHVRGVRERELRVNLLQTLTDSIDLSTPCHVANLRSPPPCKGYIDPDPFNAWNPQVARRVELALLDQVEALEDKIAGASMQIKGWTAPARDPEVENDLDLVTGIALIRERILELEAAIERRYLKPPLGTR